MSDLVQRAVWYGATAQPCLRNGETVLKTQRFTKGHYAAPLVRDNRRLQDKETGVTDDARLI
jgi:hypothetical protein